MVRWLAVGSGRYGRGPAAGAVTATSAPDGWCQRRAWRAGLRPGAAARCRSGGSGRGVVGGGWWVGSVRAATTRTAWASMARVVQRYQERQRRTWCWSKPTRPLLVLMRSSMHQRRPATLTRMASGTGRGIQSSGSRPARRWCGCGGPGASAGRRGQGRQGQAGQAPSRRSGGPWRRDRPRRTARRAPGPACAGRRRARPCRRRGLGGPGHRQHLPDAAGLQLGSQLGVGAVDLVAGHPGRRHPGVQRPRQHPPGQGGLGREPHLVGDTRRLRAVGITGPGSGQVQLPVDHGVPSATGIHQQDRDLGIVDAARGAGVLTLHPTVVVPFFRSPVSSTTSTASGSPRCSTT